MSSGKDVFYVTWFQTVDSDSFILATVLNSIVSELFVEVLEFPEGVIYIQ